MTTTKTDLEVANTILAQINALDFWARARWGVQMTLGGENELRLILARGVKIIITLTPADTYTVAMFKPPCRKTRKAIAAGKDVYTPVLVSEVEHVYADTLVRVIEKMVAR